jgi:hypothetical protein
VVFWIMTLCSLICGSQCFKNTYCSLYQVANIWTNISLHTQNYWKSQYGFELIISVTDQLSSICRMLKIRGERKECRWKIHKIFVVFKKVLWFWVESVLQHSYWIWCIHEGKCLSDNICYIKWSEIWRCFVSISFKLCFIMLLHDCCKQGLDL